MHGKRMQQQTLGAQAQEVWQNYGTAAIGA
jgi:hypothetical protein